MPYAIWFEGRFDKILVDKKQCYNVCKGLDIKPVNIQLQLVAVMLAIRYDQAPKMWDI